MVAVLTGRPCALNASATLCRVGCSRLSQIACACAGVGLSVLGASGTPGHPCFFHRVMVLEQIGRPAAVNRAATSAPLGRSRLYHSAMASAGVGLSLMRAPGKRFVGEPEASSPAGLKRKTPAAVRPRAYSYYIGNRHNGQYLGGYLSQLTTRSSIRNDSVARMSGLSFTECAKEMPLRS